MILGEIDALTADEMRNLLSGEKGQLTSSELVDAILNQTGDISENLNLLKDDGSSKMILTLDYDSHLPILITSAERAWLKYTLEDPKSNLFMLPWAKKKMEIALSDFDNLLLSGAKIIPKCPNLGTSSPKALRIFLI